MSIAGRIALITGATSGIGAATARLFAREGAKVLATGRNTDALTKLVDEINQSGGEAHGISGDVTIDDDVKAVVEGCVEKFGGLHLLVNNAGVLKGGATDAVDMANWDFNMNVNARGAFCFMTHAVKQMKTQDPNTGAIVNISSVNGLHSFGGCISYCASKAAVDMMTDCAAVDLAPFGIRVNAVNPGVTATELQKRGGLDDAAYASFIERSVSTTHPLAASLGRVATPEEVANCILFLSSPNASFVTGSHLTVDGGRIRAGLR